MFNFILLLYYINAATILDLILIFSLFSFIKKTIVFIAFYSNLDLNISIVRLNIRKFGS